MTFKCLSFWLHGCCGEWEWGPVNQVNHTSWVAVVTPTDRPKSVCNSCLIELFVALFVLSLCPFDISVSVGAFVIGLGQISSFLSSNLIVASHTQKQHVVLRLQLCQVYFVKQICFVVLSGYTQRFVAWEPFCSIRKTSVLRKSTSKFRTLYLDLFFADGKPNCLKCEFFL